MDLWRKTTESRSDCLALLPQPITVFFSRMLFLTGLKIKSFMRLSPAIAVLQNRNRNINKIEYTLYKMNCKQSEAHMVLIIQLIYGDFQVSSLAKRCIGVNRNRRPTTSTFDVFFADTAENMIVFLRSESTIGVFVLGEIWEICEYELGQTGFNAI